MHNLNVPVLGADTILVSEGQVFGKPIDSSDFKAMFAALSGKTHSVLSAVAVNNGTESLVLLSETLVTFRAITAREIMMYWDTGEPKDKAGGYAIQGYGSIFVEHIEGSYSGVVGLPIAETYRLLTKYNVPIWQSPIAE
jgi:septum formation protein